MNYLIFTLVCFVCGCAFWALQDSRNRRLKRELDEIVAAYRATMDANLDSFRARLADHRRRWDQLLADYDSMLGTATNEQQRAVCRQWFEDEFYRRFPECDRLPALDSSKAAPVG